MKGIRFYSSVVIVLQIVSWFCVTSSSRPFAPHDGSSSVYQSAGTDQSLQTHEPNFSSEEVVNRTSSSSSMMGEAEAEAEALLKGEEGRVPSKLIGSSPPSCKHKCYGCVPCEAAQVPTTTAHVGVQYANYEPEGWKCKCGPSFYTP